MQKFSIDHTYTFDLTKVEFCINTDIIHFGRTRKYYLQFIF